MHTRSVDESESNLQAKQQNQLGDVLQKTIQFFKTKGIETPRLDAELLFSHALKLQRIQLYTLHTKPLSETELNICRDLVRRRTKGEPVAYLTGSKWFFQSEFKVSPAVLIPRPETELLVELSVQNILKKNKTEVTVLDLGAGTGCIGISILNELKKKNVQTTLISVEKSETAFEILKENATRLIEEASNLKSKSRCKPLGADSKDDLGPASSTISDPTKEVSGAEIVKCTYQLILGDAATVNLSSFEGFDLIAANPPYIKPQDVNVDLDVQMFEPHSALYADDEGMKDIKEWSTHALKFLKPGGLMIFELGWDQGEKGKLWFESLGLVDVAIKKDLAEHDRFIIGTKRI